MDASFMGSMFSQLLNFAMNNHLQWQQNDWNIKLQNQNNDLQRELASQANQWSIDQWRRENEYNDPSKQVERLRAAGINPALIYGTGIMNESAPSPSVVMPNTRAPQVGRAVADFNIDPMTQSQIALNEAQAQSIRDANERENEKQPVTLQQMSQDLEQCRAKTDEILQNIKNLSIDEQIKSMQYLKSSLDYQFSSTTFNDAVDQFKTTLSNLKKVGRQADFDYNRALQYLSYEVIGWDLSNSRQRALLNIDRQTYRQTEELFEDVKRQVYWNSQNAYMDWRLKGKEEGKYIREYNLMDADLNLKELSFWIEARDNPVAFQRFARENGIDERRLFNNGLGKFFTEFSDVWNHGLNLPIRIGFK